MVKLSPAPFSLIYSLSFRQESIPLLANNCKSLTENNRTGRVTLVSIIVAANYYDYDRLYPLAVGVWLVGLIIYGIRQGEDERIERENNEAQRDLENLRKQKK
jgi:hypothetical protein